MDYIVEREYLGKTSIKELIGRIIRKHNGTNREYRISYHEKTVEESLDLE